MSIFGIILLVIGLILFFVQKNYSTKLRSIRLATFSTIADLQEIANAIAGEIGNGNLREYVKVRGTIRCNRPLISELKQEPCVYYTMRVTREFEETVRSTDSNGKSQTETRRGSETISSNTQSLPFQVQDSTGMITVVVDGGDIETVKVLDEFQREGSSTSISFGSFNISTSSNFGDRRTLGYRYTESILPCDREVLVIGTAVDENGKLTLRKPIQSDRKMIVSLKSEEELTKATANAAQGLFYGMVACLVIGFILLVVGLVLKT
ncbi:MAG: E3 ubiquitin ligase family protein [Pseudanabaenaceae cyanobacterium bins.39]|nr:E3 ubiquitin ligase family protein [Pseudanabaenaceae cyanobacterium bins.39]